MRNILTLAACSIVSTLILQSCNDNSNEQTQVSGETSATGARSATGASSASFTEGDDYTLFERTRVMDDKGFTTPAEAYSLLIPKGWSHQGEIIWNGPGSGCDGTNHRFKASSPDGSYSIEILPMYLWNWSSNEQLRQIQQSNPVNSPYCSYGEPMDAEEYLRNRFAGELGNPEISDVSSNSDAIAGMEATNDKGRQELMRYGASDVQFRQTAVNADLEFPNGTAGIVFCAVSNIQTTIPNVYNGTYDQSITSQAQQRIVFRFPKGERAQASKMLSVIMGSIRTNPYWRDEINAFWKNVREQKQVVHIGRIRMMDAQTRAIGERTIANGNQRLADMDGEMRNWEQKQASSDRIHGDFIKMIRGVENYQDASGKVELSSAYDHAWSRGDGSAYIMSNNSNFDPSSVFQDQQWQEMKKVD